METEEDIYGEDLTGASAHQPEEPSQPAVSAVENDTSQAEASREYEVELQSLRNTVAEWQSISDLAGVAEAFVMGPVTPAAVASELVRARESEKQLQADVLVANSKVAALEAALAARSVEQVQLRRHLHAARQALDPHIIQVRQLLLDPAVNREFERLRAEVEAKAREVKGLQEELQAVHFSQDSKSGRMLMAKCRALQDENEEMGRELAEGKLHAVERQAALAKTFADDLRKAFAEVEDHVHTLDAENEDLQAQLFALRRQQQDRFARPDRGFQDGYRKRMQPPPVDNRGYDARRRLR